MGYEKKSKMNYAKYLRKMRREIKTQDMRTCSFQVGELVIDDGTLKILPADRDYFYCGLTVHSIVGVRNEEGVMFKTETISGSICNEDICPVKKLLNVQASMWFQGLFTHPRVRK